MQKIKNLGFCNKIGFSIYTEKLGISLSERFIFDVIQIPLNFANCEFSERNLIKYFSKRNIEVHVRSVFHQGLLLLTKNNLPNKFKKFAREWKDYEKRLNAYNINSLTACLSFIFKIKSVNKIIIGINSFSQIKEILNTKLSKKKINFQKLLQINDKRFYDPRLW